MRASSENPFRREAHARGEQHAACYGEVVLDRETRRDDAAHQAYERSKPGHSYLTVSSEW